MEACNANKNAESGGLEAIQGYFIYHDSLALSRDPRESLLVFL